MNFHQRQARTQRLRALPLARVLALCGAQPDGRDPRKWHTARGVLSITGARFMNWSLGQGGGGAIDLVMQLKSLDFQKAVDWLAQQSGQDGKPERPAQATVAVRLRLPTPDPRWLGRVKDYLVLARAIPLEVLAPLLTAGTVYADGRTNAVFLLRDRQNVPVGAELRGTGEGCWRGMAPGSRKDRGFFWVGTPTEETVILCESAIDALSCRALHPEHACLSTAGARPNPRWLHWLLEHGTEILCGYDTDVTGEAMAEALISLYPAVRRLRPRAHDWNDQLKARSRLVAGPDLANQEASATWKEEIGHPA